MCVCVCVCVCVCAHACVHIGMCLCVCDRERDMPYEVTLVAQRVKAALPVGLSLVGTYTSSLSMRTVAVPNIVFYQFCYFQHYALDRVLEEQGL